MALEEFAYENRIARPLHREQVPEAIRIPPAPDASATTLPTRAHKQAYFLNHVASYDDAAHGEVQISAGVKVQRSGNRNQESQN
jgi:hypothetical protein